MIPCGHCGAIFERSRDWSRFCSSSCRARAHRGKNASLDHVTEHSNKPADKALTLPDRLRGYALPTKRMTAARKLVDRLLQVEKDPAAMLRALQCLEKGLISLGGSYDEHLAQALERPNAFSQVPSWW